MAKKRILLVEDEIITAMDLESELIELGYEVPAIAASGDEAIRMAAAIQPDLILMDITLAGGMTGIEAAEQIRLAQQIPVIFLTAHGDSETLAMAKTAQPYGYLTKPCSLDSMMRTIEVALYKSEADAKVREINAELTSFAYTISHDLGSPLVTIRGFIAILLKKLAAGNYEHVNEYLQQIDRAAGKMETLLHDLLELSLAGKIINAPEKIAMGELVENVLRLLEGPIRADGVTVSVQSDLPVVTADSLRLSQVLQNLLENAIKHGRDQSDLHIHIGVRQDGEERIFFVQDNGAGIDHRHHESIFGLFTRLNAKNEGTGVGLALAKRIINAHGGRIWVESEGVSKGSCFCFTLGFG